MNRRAFLRGALTTAAAASAAGAGLVLQGCSKGRDLDLLIAGGTVYDGSGGPPVRADVGVSGGAIREIGRVRRSRAAAVIEADGRAVSPGFIDVHDHTDVGLLVNPRAESAVRQGVTTLVSGQCGESPFPLTDEAAAENKLKLAREYGLDVEWKDIGGFLDRLETSGLALNYATFVGQGTVRGAVLGQADRPATAAELERMKALVAEAMAGGALGLSSGLEYTPSSFASTGELIELCRVAARTGGVYATHLRDEEAQVVEAVAEALRIAREAPIRLQISHLKVGFAVNWPKLDAILDMLEKARAEGLDFRCDRYPYIASATSLSTLFPVWAREGGTEAFLARLKDPAFDARIRAHMAEQEKGYGSWDKIRISDVGSEKNRGLEGSNVLEAAAAAGRPGYEFMRDLLIEESGRVGMISFYGSEENLERILGRPFVGIGADGSALAPYGPLAKGKPHPRNYGTFPRALGKYVRERKVVPLAEMIRKMTAMPAAQMGFVRRGRIKVGWAADLCVFDADRIIDKATFQEPAAYPEGIHQVVVNGRIVLDEGRHAEELPGRVLRKNARGAVA
ncbi:MAG TPA: D-aminoacylase [Candidatus Aminicenantes bacterium]|nr:D-aminoacylase [Candidatus Aminicenantes bacterium]HRY65330.1 D-aminoacylase [Candidatus Aminicenantes bacterium]HRZ72202.1 D-aminoacylase [Candidatus Aminicenantes bacterium]